MNSHFHKFFQQIFLGDFMKIALHLHPHHPRGVLTLPVVRTGNIKKGLADMNTFTKLEDGTISVPAIGEQIARIFSAGKPHETIAHAIKIMGEENFKSLVDYLPELEGVSRDTLLGNLCEGWQGDMAALAASVDLLSKLSADCAMRAVFAQHLGKQCPNIILDMLPFYRVMAGLVP